MNIRAYLDTLDLSDGQSLRKDCPSCRAKNTFTVSNDGGSMVYNCYKLNCTLSGAYHRNMTAQEIQLRLVKQKLSKPPEIETMVIPEYVVQPTDEHPLLHKYISDWDIPSDNLMYDVKDSRIVFPIYHTGRLIDANGRSLTGKQPKWLRYTGNAHYYMTGKAKDVILVVEDIVSAMVAHQMVPSLSAMAILGTSLTLKHIAKLGEYNRIVVALDPDASHETLAFKREIELWTNVETIALRLDDDIKYRLASDIENLKEVT